jgi:serine phosphatase RsbU (regulator of sigma subunit)
VQGVLTLAQSDPGAPPPTAELLLAVARQAGLALDRARLYEQSASVARVLQRSMLTDPAQPDHLELITRYLPAATDTEVGGDWYDAFPGPDGATWLVVGDVAGHDIAAAAVMGQIRNLLRGIAHAQQHSPARVLTALDHAMAGLGVPSLATVVALRIEPTRGDATGVRHVRWSNAGHPPPVHLPLGGTPRPLDTLPEVLLGAVPDSARTDHELDLGPGDTLLLYTDGLTERRTADLDAGTRWLLDVLAAHAGDTLTDLCDHLVHAVADHVEDDVALLALRADR